MKDLAITRITFNGIDDTTTFPDQWVTHNQIAYTKPPANSGRSPRSDKLVQKNISHLPGMAAGPGGHKDFFNTTTGSIYTAPPNPPSASPRHMATFKQKMEATDIFGVGTWASSESQVKMSTASAMGGDTMLAQRQPNPRYVHGGGHRNTSMVSLDRNLVEQLGGDAPKFGTTTAAGLNWPDGAPRPTHKFNMPQKNTSTFMSTSLAIPDGGDGATVDLFSTQTNHNLPYSDHYRSKPVGGHQHYNTSYHSHYSDTAGVKLRVPPGKGGVDMTRSTIPLGERDLPFTQAHSAAMYTGQQVPEAERVRCVGSRGTLGAKVLHGTHRSRYHLERPGNQGSSSRRAPGVAPL